MRTSSLDYRPGFNYGITNHANRVIVREYMLQGEAIENGTMVFTLEGGLALARAFVPYLLNGDKCRLELPENWRNKFSGFLFCGVGNYMCIHITLEQHMGGSMDSQHEVEWKESDDDDDDDYDYDYDDDDDDDVGDDDDGDQMTCVGCLSFASLRDSWWDQTYNHLEFSIGDPESGFRLFGVRLIPRRSERGSSGPTDFSHLKIKYISASALVIKFPRRLYP